MNERILELADKAVEDLPSGPWNIPDEFCKKFAELIVLDTIKNCRDMFMVNSVSWNLLNEKLEHFGVKE